MTTKPGKGIHLSITDKKKNRKKSKQELMEWWASEALQRGVVLTASTPVKHTPKYNIYSDDDELTPEGE